MSLLVLLGGLLTASAGEYYLETPTLSDRAEAIELQQAALEQGLSTRLVRRWQHGVGWGYAVVIDGLPDRATADDVAEDIAALTRRGVSVYAVATEPAAREPSDQPPAEGTVDPLPPVSDALERVIRAHGGRDGGIARLEEAEAVRFRYDRRVVTDAGEVSARHDWWGEGAARHISVEILGGPGQSFVGEVGADRAWLEVDGVRHERSVDRAREVLDGLGPASVLSTALRVPAAAASADVPFTSPGMVTVDQRECLALQQEVGIDRGRLELAVDLTDWTVARTVVQTASGAVMTTFDDWREVDTGVVIPFRLRVTHDGAFQEEIRVIELDLSPGADREP